MMMRRMLSVSSAAETSSFDASSGDSTTAAASDEPLLIEAAAVQVGVAEVHILVEGTQTMRTIQHHLALSTAWHPIHAVRARRVMSSV
jgi:hypothetical protein